MRFALIYLLLLTGCTSQFAALRNNRDSTLNDLRMEVADLRHAVHSNEMEVKLLEDRLEFSEREEPRADEFLSLKKKIAILEKTLDKMNNEIRSLTNYAGQTSASFESYRQQITAIDHKLGEISKLRASLTKLSETPSTPASYQVQPGDSLQKIARKHQVSIDALKKENHLSSDKIIVGQKLLIPQ